MEQYKFVIKLRNLGCEEITHEETLFAKEEDCRVLYIGFKKYLYIPKRSYVASNLLPYFDLLHDYEVIEVSAQNSIGETNRWIHRRVALENCEW